MQEEPEPFALVPAHAQLLTCCDFDAAGTRLLCGDAAGSVLLFTVPPGAPSSSRLLHSFAAHSSPISLLTFTGADNLLLTGADGNLDLSLWDTSSGYNSNEYTPSALHTLRLRCPSPAEADGGRHLSATYEPSHGVLLLSCAHPGDDASELLAVSLARRGADSAFGSLTAFQPEL